MPKPAVIPTVTSRSFAARGLSTSRDQMYAVGRASTKVRTKSSTIVKLPVTSRIARLMAAQPATTARRNQCGIVPPATVGPPRTVASCSAGSKAAATFSWRWSFIASSLQVRSGDDEPGDHVDHECDAEEDEPRGNQGVDVDAGGLGELERDVRRDRGWVLLAHQVEGDDSGDGENDRHRHRLAERAAESQHRSADHGRLPEWQHGHADHLPARCPEGERSLLEPTGGLREDFPRDRGDD